MFDAPAVLVNINHLWLPFVMGQLYPFTQADLWTGIEAEQDAATQQVEDLLYALAGNIPPEDTMIVTEIDLVFSDTFPALVRGCVTGETADECLLTIDTAFDAGVLTVGIDSDPAILMDTIDLTQFAPGDQIQLSPQYRFLANADVKAYLTGSPTTGAARLTLYTYLPEA